ncbi:hypothetical protein [Propionivibrio dicarboxylicus]|uniref:Uncharacterized protein n=1 Tax=Propionivibrio dicarboxylicus TaxID=83767 RepID=A0A1G8A8A2_9RHOO|nr:hypothetical protein [Propionivibrio dicarboxylicus]SDH17159.1 hypothetical protein SAMN05660652_01311 [Propionivibrio dicarboxylicus]
MCRLTDKYLRAVNKIGPEYLDNYIATRTDKKTQFVPVQTPPPRWSRAKGAMTDGTGSHHGSPATVNATRDSFVSQFVTDMKNDFGKQLALECINRHHTDPSKPLSARQVKQIIEEAQTRTKESANIPPPLRKNPPTRRRMTRPFRTSSIATNSAPSSPNRTVRRSCTNSDQALDQRNSCDSPPAILLGLERSTTSPPGKT